MCTNFTPTRKAEWAKQSLGVDLPSADYPAETYPGYAAPIVVRGHESGRVACGLARFGLIPAWAKDNKIGRHTYNARSETASTKPSYRTAWQRRQYGIVLLDDFFEPNYETGRAVKWRIQLASSQPMGIACLWDRWTNPASCERVVSFTMLTTNADTHPVMRQFHAAADEKRTPVVLAEDQYLDWLSATPEQAADFMNWAHMPELRAAPAIALS